MILANIKDCSRYFSVHPLFEKAFNYFKENYSSIEDGKYMIEGDELYVMFSTGELRPIEKCRMETHDRYIDIQVVIKGTETYGITERANLTDSQGYNDVKDVEFYSVEVKNKVTLTDGDFLILFPEDGHMPLIGEGAIKKAVIKVKL